MTTFARDSLLLTFRSLRAIPRVPERILDVTIQPIVFILLFRYVFGSAIHVPGVDELLELPDARPDRPGPRVRDHRRRRGNQPRHGRGRARPLPLDAGQPLSIVTGQVLGQFAEAVLGLAVYTAIGLCAAGARTSASGTRFDWVGLMLLGTFAFTWVGAYLGMLVRSPDAMQGVGFIIVFPLALPRWRLCADPEDGRGADGRSASGIRSARWSRPHSKLADGFPSHGSWLLTHGELAMVIWSLALLAIFVPLALHRFNNTVSA